VAAQATECHPSLELTVLRERCRGIVSVGLATAYFYAVKTPYAPPHIPHPLRCGIASRALVAAWVLPNVLRIIRCVGPYSGSAGWAMAG